MPVWITLQILKCLIAVALIKRSETFSMPPHALHPYLVTQDHFNVSLSRTFFPRCVASLCFSWGFARHSRSESAILNFWLVAQLLQPPVDFLPDDSSHPLDLPGLLVQRLVSIKLAAVIFQLHFCFVHLTRRENIASCALRHHLVCICH